MEAETGQEQRQAWQAGVLPPVEQVVPGLWSIPVPIPDNPLRYTLVYAFVLAREAGVVLVDAGWDSEETWQALVSGLATIGVTPADVHGVAVTHMHPDHHGLARRVHAASGAWVALHPEDAEQLRRIDPDTAVQHNRNWLLAAGVPAAMASELAGSPEMVRPFLSFARPDRLVRDGDRLPVPGWDVRVVWTPGHTPGHICLYERERKLLLSGDHVLPRISPNISQQGSDGVPLRAYLDSLTKVTEYEVGEVLPAHQWRFRELGERVTELQEHHHERLAELETLIQHEPGRTTWDLTAAATWSRPWSEIRGFMRRAALGETSAHLHVLAHGGRVRHATGPPERWFAADTAPAS